MSNLSGKVVAITGASSGIGEAAARYLAASGARLVIGARRTDRLEHLAATIASQGGDIRFAALDVTRRSDLEAFVGLALSAYGRLDVLVNNAGVMPLSPLDALKVDEWDRMIDVNIKGVLYGIAAALPVMKQQGFGQIVMCPRSAAIASARRRQSIVLPNTPCARSRTGSDRRMIASA